jgi:RNA polymerase sigma factor (sigma-70 family)
MNTTNNSAPTPALNSPFVTTHWSVVLSAQGNTTLRRQAALETLCRTYWYPLYAYVRRQGHSPQDAEDLTQEFFARLLEKDYLKAAERDKGRFRTFLLVVLKRFLANEWDRARALKRGGNQPHVSFDTAAVETRYQIEPFPGLEADRIYDRRWAMALLETTMSRLREEFRTAGKTAEFDGLKTFLATAKTTNAYADVAKAIGMSEGAVRVATHRLRRRFREIFREEISQTVSTTQEIDEEVRYLMSVLAD